MEAAATICVSVLILVYGQRELARRQVRDARLLLHRCRGLAINPRVIL